MSAERKAELGWERSAGHLWPPARLLVLGGGRGGEDGELFSEAEEQEAAAALGSNMLPPAGAEK